MDGGGGGGAPRLTIPGAAGMDGRFISPSKTSRSEPPLSLIRLVLLLGRGTAGPKSRTFLRTQHSTAGADVLETVDSP